MFVVFICLVVGVFCLVFIVVGVFCLVFIVVGVFDITALAGPPFSSRGLRSGTCRLRQGGRVSDHHHHALSASESHIQAPIIFQKTNPSFGKDAETCVCARACVFVRV